MTRIATSRRTFLAGLAAASGAALAAPALATTLSRPDLTIGWTTWSDAEIVTKLVARVLATRGGYDIELTLADIEAQFRTISKGDIDLMLMSWEPDLHAPYLRQYGRNLTDLGTLYEGTIGLAVPEWVPQDMISSIDDLRRADVQEALEGKITGIDPKAGLMATTRAAIDAYGLTGYELTEGTGPRMVRAIAKAQRTASPIVVTAWRPHQKFPLYGMRYLADPKGLFAASSQIHARANAGFVQTHPQIAAAISRISFQVPEIEQMMLDARENGTEEAIDRWIDANPDRIAAWLA